MSEYKKNKIVVSVKEILNGQDPDLLERAIVYCLTREISPEVTADIFFIQKGPFVAYFRLHKDDYVPLIVDVVEPAASESVATLEVRPKFSEDEKLRIVEIYQSGKSLNLTAVTAAKELKKFISLGEVRKVLKELNVPIRPTGGQPGKSIYRETEFPKRNRI